jgi:hypothetical protein
MYDNASNSDTKQHLPGPPWAARHRWTVSISFCATQGGQVKYCRAAQVDWRVSLLPTFSLTNITNVNAPLATKSQLTKSSNLYYI